tara:strand:- start:28 stop:864 length:837 start_codon:yes stop_codon:yes gene_type:complete
MRGGKSYGKLLLHVAQVIILFSLIQAVNTQTWYTGVVDVEYSEGLPKGSGMEVELEVDQESADGSIHIDGFITFMNWQNTRNDTSIPADTAEDDDNQMDLIPLSEVQQNVPMYSKIALSLGILLFGLTFFEIKNRAIIGLILNGLVFWILVSLIVLAPLGYIGGMEFGTGSIDDDGESTVHRSMEGSSSIDIFDGDFDYNFEIKEYDLGLVNQNDLEEVIADSPGEEHRSFIEMDGQAGIHYGAFVFELFWAWLLLFVASPMAVGLVNRVSIQKPQLL